MTVAIPTTSSISNRNGPSRHGERDAVAPEVDSASVLDGFTSGSTNSTMAASQQVLASAMNKNA